jgi:hypothetical protein
VREGSSWPAGCRQALGFTLSDPILVAIDNAANERYTIVTSALHHYIPTALLPFIIAFLGLEHVKLVTSSSSSTIKSPTNKAAAKK